MSNLEYIVDTLQTVHKGDKDALETLVLSAISAHPSFTIKLNVALVGDSDAGKTHVGETVLGIIPNEYQYETYKVTPKVLYYQALGNPEKGIAPYSFYNKTIFLDDITDNDREILKNIANTSNKPPSFTTLVKQKPYTITFNHAPVVWTSRVDLIEDYQAQADRRFYTIEVNGSPAVLDHIVNIECNNKKPQCSEEMDKAKNIMKDVMLQEVQVEVPANFDHSFVKTKSGIRFLIAMIRSIAKINVFSNRQTKATQQDIEEGIRLYKSNETQQKKLKRNALELLKYIPKDAPKIHNIEFPESSGKPYTVEGIYEAADKNGLNIGIASVRKILESLEKQSYITAIPGRTTTRKLYYQV